MRCDSGRSETSRCSCGGIALWAVSIVATTFAWVSITPFGVAGRAAREDDLEQVLGDGSGPGGDLVGPVGGPVRVGLGREVLDRRGREVLEARLPRVRRVASAADRQVRRLRLPTIRSIASGAIRRSSGTTTTPTRIAPK